MKILRIVIIALAIVQLGFAALGLFGASFADGGTLLDRIFLGIAVPAASIVFLALAVMERPPAIITWVGVGLMALAVGYGGVVSVLIATGEIKGDWQIPLVFVAILGLGLAYLAVRGFIRKDPA